MHIAGPDCRAVNSTPLLHSPSPPSLVLQAIQPKLEALEEAWSRLHTITGADSPEKLIAYWKGDSPSFSRALTQQSSLHVLLTAGIMFQLFSTAVHRLASFGRVRGGYITYFSFRLEYVA